MALVLKQLFSKKAKAVFVDFETQEKSPVLMSLSQKEGL